MYPLGSQFEVDNTKAKSDKKAIILGRTFRISVISERIVRLEYSSSGQFLDRPTQFIKKRNIILNFIFKIPFKIKILLIFYIFISKNSIKLVFDSIDSLNCQYIK